MPNYNSIFAVASPATTSTVRCVYIRATRAPNISYGLLDAGRATLGEAIFKYHGRLAQYLHGKSNQVSNDAMAPAGLSPP